MSNSTDPDDTAAANPPLPDAVRALLWEYGETSITWRNHAHLITRKVLAHGELEAIAWLRKTLTDDGISQWLTANRGGGLEPRILRFWQVVLGLEDAVVEQWLEAGDKGIWGNRRT